MKVRIAAMRGRPDCCGINHQQLELGSDAYTNTITSVQKDNLIITEPQVLRPERTEFGKRIRKSYESGGVKMSRHQMTHLSPRKDGISNTLTTVQKDNLVLLREQNMNDDSITMIGGLQKHQLPRNDGICPCINSAAGMGGGQTPIAIRPKYRVRKLTQKECWRLMGFDDSDYEKARKRMNNSFYKGRDRSGSQLYKQAGNSIVVDVLQQIMGELYTAMPYLFDDMEVGSFFSGIGAFEKALQRLGELGQQESDEDCKNDLELHQIGYINDNNATANRIYDDGIAVTLKADAGGGGAKTGWYRVQT